MLWCETSTTTTYRVSRKISATYAQLAVACFDEFSADLPLVLRNLSAGFCTGEVAEFPRNLRTFSTRSAHVFDERLRCNLRCVFRNDFGRNPQVIADAAGEKNGEKKAVDGSVWKSAPECTRNVARGTISAGFVEILRVIPSVSEGPWGDRKSV